MVVNVWGAEIKRSPARASVVPAVQERPRCSDWARAVLGFEADEVQREVPCRTRQWGKTTVTAARVLYEMWFTPGTLVAVVSVTRRQSQILLSKVMTMARERLGVAVRPFLATPAGQAGFFYDAWHGGGAGWTRVMVKAPDCPRIPAEFLEEERAALGEHQFRQEYLCEFLASRGQLVPRDVFDAAVTEKEEPLDVSMMFGKERRG